MSQLRKFPALLLFLLFVSVMFFPTHALATEEAMDASGKAATPTLSVSSSHAKDQASKPETT